MFQNKPRINTNITNYIYNIIYMWNKNIQIVPYIWHNNTYYLIQ